VQGGGSVPVSYLLQVNNAPKVPHKYDIEERELLSLSEIQNLKQTDNTAAREASRHRSEFIKTRQSEALHPEPLVPMQAPDPPLAPTMNALEPFYRYRYNENHQGWVSRPFVDTNGPDKSDGISGGQSERSYTLRPPKKFVGGVVGRLFLQVCSCPLSEISSIAA
jgi:hypothetical protein